MLPAELMGLNSNNFKQLNNLIKNKNFLNSLISNVSSTYITLKKKNLIQSLLIMMKNLKIYFIGISN